MNEIKSRADLFEAAEKMIRMCDEAGVHCYAKYNGIIRRIGEIDLQGIDPKKFEPFLAIVEGKPVFVDDKMFDRNGKEVTITRTGVEYRDSEGILKSSIGFAYGIFPRCEYSWLPPKPRTVMVELLREDAEHAAMNWIDNIAGPMTNIGAACRKALENEK